MSKFCSEHGLPIIRRVAPVMEATITDEECVPLPVDVLFQDVCSQCLIDSQVKAFKSIGWSEKCVYHRGHVLYDEDGWYEAECGFRFHDTEIYKDYVFCPKCSRLLVRDKKT